MKILLKVALVVFASATAPAAAAAAAEPLTPGKAKAHAKRVLKDQFPGHGRLVVDCKRGTGMRRTCAVDLTAWGPTRYRGTLVFHRSGIAGSPVDTFTLRLKPGKRGEPSVRQVGRMVVETRVANTGSALRLWGRDREQIDVTVGEPAIVAPADEFSAPPQGRSYLTFPVSAVNAGAGRWDFGFSLARLVLDNGAVLDTGYVPGCSTAIDFAPTEQRLACIGFVVPDGAVWTQLEWKAGNETGVWISPPR